MAFVNDALNDIEEQGGYRNRPVSWVRRGVRMTEGQEVAWQQHGQKYLVEPPRGIARESIVPGWVLDPAQVFGTAQTPRGFETPLVSTPRDMLRDRSTAGPANAGPSTAGPANAAQTQTKFVIEIGTGRGENIVSAAAREPETNFLGVEVYGPGLARAILLAESAGTGVPLPHLGPDIAEAVANARVAYGAVLDSATAAVGLAQNDELTSGVRSEIDDVPDDAAVTGLPNLRLIQADAPELLDSLPENSVDEFWVFFPDPWPKTKHLKRRLIDNEFATQLAKVLKPGGIIRLATDWAHYAEQMSEVFAASSNFEPLETADGHTDRFNGRVLTAFESKGIREGRSITDLAYRRI